MSYRPDRAPRIGDLRERVTLQEHVKIGTDKMNAAIYDWQDRGRVAARVEPEKGGERFLEKGGIRISDAMLRVSIRYRADVSVEWRLLWERGPNDRRVLDIRAIANADERRRFLQLDCRNADEARE